MLLLCEENGDERKERANLEAASMREKSDQGFGKLEGWVFYRYTPFMRELPLCPWNWSVALLRDYIDNVIIIHAAQRQQIQNSPTYDLRSA